MVFARRLTKCLSVLGVAVLEDVPVVEGQEALNAVNVVEVGGRVITTVGHLAHVGVAEEVVSHLVLVVVVLDVVQRAMVQVVHSAIGWFSI